jgi:hypothetical protein
MELSWGDYGENVTKLRKWKMCLISFKYKDSNLLSSRKFSFDFCFFKW